MNTLAPPRPDIANALERIRMYTDKASHHVYELAEKGHHLPDIDKMEHEMEHGAKASHYIEQALIASILLAEAYQWEFVLKILRREYDAAKAKGFVRINHRGEDASDDTLDRLWQVLDCIEELYVFRGTPVTRDLVEILRASVYSITDRACFSKPPKDEKDVHLRIEAVLRCVFPDLLHTPSISKPIKNFAPDTGIKSLETLIEYKFITNAKEAKRVADEVLADTRGYSGSDWKHFVYVIYETKRIKAETEWTQLLAACGTAENSTIIVICGEPPAADPGTKTIPGRHKSAPAAQ
jgi:hypothetical protein